MNQFCVMLRINDGEWMTIAACDSLAAAKAFAARHARFNKGTIETKEYQVVMARVEVETSLSVLWTRKFP